MVQKVSSELADTTKSPEELLAAAIDDGKQKSGVNALPAPEKVPPAFSYGSGAQANPRAGEMSQESISAAMNAAVAEQAVATVQRGGVIGAALPKDLEVNAAALAEAYAQKAPPPMPAQIAVGQQTFMVPGSIRTAPWKLHNENPAQAEKLWHYFIADPQLRKELAMWAAKKNFLTVPFCWVASAIFEAFEMDGWFPMNDGSWPPFTDVDRDRNHAQYKALIDVFGPELARIIVREAERGNVSVRACTVMAGWKCHEKHKEQLDRLMRSQQVTRWT